MRSSKKTTALVLTGAIGVASAAYGIGSQVGGGSAAAENGSARAGSAQDGPDFGGPGDREERLDNLADTLGVDASKLEGAFRDFHEQHRGDRQADFAAALGKALGKSADEVQAALDGLADKRVARIASRLADELGVDSDRVASSLRELRSDEELDPRDIATELGSKLGVDTEKVENALQEIRPGAPGRSHGKGALPLRELATALDVTRPELRKAFRDLRANADVGPKNLRADLVTFLAERLGISKDKVDEALPEFPGPGREGGPGPGGPFGGPGGPGGPGGGGPGPGGPGFGPGSGIPG